MNSLKLHNQLQARKMAGASKRELKDLRDQYEAALAAEQKEAKENRDA